VGILGGTFNPPHLGHLGLARHALRVLALERVVLMPASRSPFKPSAPDPGPQHRLHMCELLLGDTDGLSACGLEVERGGASYTADTLSAINASHPNAELTFIVGADTARTIPTWHEPARILESARLAIAPRDGGKRDELVGSLESVATHGPDIVFLEMPPIAASSSEARRRAAAGEAIADLVGPQVAGYIAEHGLYRDRHGGRG
jgi:nicotinate-nucleotide adenylyltransferase